MARDLTMDKPMGTPLPTLKESMLLFESIPVRFFEGGAGFPVLLLHGSGPGVSLEGNFRRVLDGLTARYRVVGMDWIGFGRSGRAPTPPYFNMALWERQLSFALDRVGAESVGILAHSLAAVCALKAAAKDRRVVKVLTTGAMGTRFKANQYLERIWSFPATPAAVREAMECLVWDRSLVTDGLVQDRYAMLQRDDYCAYFSAMFAGDKQQYVDQSTLADDIINAVSSDVLMMHGRDDLPFPFEQTSAVLSRRLRNADVWAVARCGHSPSLEHPDKVLAAATALFG